MIQTLFSRRFISSTRSLFLKYHTFCLMRQMHFYWSKCILSSFSALFGWLIDRKTSSLQNPTAESPPKKSIFWKIALAGVTQNTSDKTYR